MFYGRLKQFLIQNDVKNDKKGPLLLTLLSDDTYKILQNLIHPKNFESAAYNDLLAALNKQEANRATGESVEE